MYYVYVLKRKNNDWYIGFTGDLKRRFTEHRQKYDCTLVYFESYQTSELARDRELKLKHYGSAWRALKDRITTYGVG